MNSTRLDSITRLPGAKPIAPVLRSFSGGGITAPNGYHIRPLASLRQTAASRQSGYLEACLKLGTLNATGQYITFSRDAFAQIRKQFSLKSAPIKVIKPCC